MAKLTGRVIEVDFLSGVRVRRGGRTAPLSAAVASIVAPLRIQVLER